MDSRWFKGLTDEEKKARKKELLSYRNAFNELKALLEDQFEEGSPSYEHSAWAYEQADRNGANRKLRSILKLLEID